MFISTCICFHVWLYVCMCTCMCVCVHACVLSALDREAGQPGLKKKKKRAWWNKSIFWPPLATTWTNEIWKILLKPIAPRHCRFVLAKLIIELIPLFYWKCCGLGIDIAKIAIGENKSRLPLCFNLLWSQFFLPLLNHWVLPRMLNSDKGDK